MTNGFPKVANTGPTPGPRADDVHSYQSVAKEERLQRLSFSKDRKAKNQKVYENANHESMDETTSPLFNRLDSQNSYRNHKQAQSKVK